MDNHRSQTPESQPDKNMQHTSLSSLSMLYPQMNQYALTMKGRDELKGTLFMMACETAHNVDHDSDTQPFPPPRE